MIKDGVQFFREVRSEAMRVTWPTRKEVTIWTVVVAVMVAIMAMFLLGVDFLVSHGIQYILDLGQGK